MGDGHGVLGGVPVAQAGAASHLNEGGEAGEHHVDLALVQVPGVEHHVHVRVGGGHLEPGQLFIPVPGQVGEGRVHGGKAAVLLPDAPALLQTPLPQHPDQAGPFSRGQGQLLFQDGTVVVSFLEGGETRPPLHRQRVGLGAVGAQKTVPQAVEAVRDKGGGHELVGVLIKQLIVDDSVLTAAPGAVEGHLEILVVNGNLMVGKFGVGVYAQGAGAVRSVFQSQVP